MRQCHGISMPTAVFVEAVRMASAPCAVAQEGHAAIKHMTDWWNAASSPEFQCAYALSLYVRFGDDWLSGDPEEGWVDGEAWARRRPHSYSTATLLGGRVRVEFYKEAVSLGGYGYDARAVDGSHGEIGVAWSGITANGVLTRYAHQALSYVPVRFPEIWRLACAEVGCQIGDLPE
jgi:hypothetical protein